ncbi:unnamed protein product [Closterium sp. Yama58-4]|nr:unnamed protein product [Closterium sp. Yama58-4]
MRRRTGSGCGDVRLRQQRRKSASPFPSAADCGGLSGFHPQDAAAETAERMAEAAEGDEMAQTRGQFRTAAGSAATGASIDGEEFFWARVTVTPLDAAITFSKAENQLGFENSHKFVGKTISECRAGLRADRPGEADAENATGRWGGGAAIYGESAADGTDARRAFDPSAAVARVANRGNSGADGINAREAVSGSGAGGIVAREGIPQQSSAEGSVLRASARCGSSAAEAGGGEAEGLGAEQLGAEGLDAERKWKKRRHHAASEGAMAEQPLYERHSGDHSSSEGDLSGREGNAVVAACDDEACGDSDGACDVSGGGGDGNIGGLVLGGVGNGSAAAAVDGNANEGGAGGYDGGGGGDGGASIAEQLLARMEEVARLRLSEENVRYRAVFELSMVPINSIYYLQNPDSSFDCNEAAVTILGCFLSSPSPHSLSIHPPPLTLCPYTPLPSLSVHTPPSPHSLSIHPPPLTLCPYTPLPSLSVHTPPSPHSLSIHPPPLTLCPYTPLPSLSVHTPPSPHSLSIHPPPLTLCPYTPLPSLSVHTPPSPHSLSIHPPPLTLCPYTPLPSLSVHTPPSPHSLSIHPPPLTLCPYTPLPSLSVHTPPSPHSLSIHPPPLTLCPYTPLPSLSVHTPPSPHSLSIHPPPLTLCPYTPLPSLSVHTPPSPHSLSIHPPPLTLCPYTPLPSLSVHTPPSPHSLSIHPPPLTLCPYTPLPSLSVHTPPSPHSLSIHPPPLTLCPYTPLPSLSVHTPPSPHSLSIHPPPLTLCPYTPLPSLSVHTPPSPHSLSIHLSWHIVAAGRDCVIVVWHDMREAKRREEELRHAKEAAEAASRAKTQFLANMSHELRTPMNGVLGVVELLLSSGMSSEQRALLHVVRASGESLVRILSDLLDITRIESSSLALSLAPFCLHSAVDSTLALMRVVALKKGLQLSVTIDPSTPQEVVGDAMRFRQVLLNLLSNAIKFTDRHPGAPHHSLPLCFPSLLSCDRSPSLVPLKEPTAAPLAQHSHAALTPCVYPSPLQRLCGMAVHVTGLNKPSLIACPFLSLCAFLPSHSRGSVADTGIGMAPHIIPEGQERQQGQDGQQGGQEGQDDGSVEWVQVRVQDTGIGMAAHTMPHIFHPFTQADSSSSRRFGGTGLGLAICHSLIGLMGGRIEVESQLGAGTTFTVCVPFGQWKSEDNRVNQLVVTHGEDAWRDEAQEQGRKQGLRHGADEGEGAKSLFEGMRCLVAEDNRVNQLVVTHGEDAWRDEAQEQGRKQGQRHGADEGEGTKSPFEGMRCLVAEDNRVNQLVVTRMLHSLGVACDVAINGREAVDKCAQRDYDLVLMDCHMPEMDGFEATRLILQHYTDQNKVPYFNSNGTSSGFDSSIAAPASAAAAASQGKLTEMTSKADRDIESQECTYRRKQRIRRPRIIALTASALASDRERCMEVGMDSFITKPLKPSELQREPVFTVRLSHSITVPAAAFRAASNPKSHRAVIVIASADPSNDLPISTALNPNIATLSGLDGRSRSSDGKPSRPSVATSAAASSAGYVTQLGGGGAEEALSKAGVTLPEDMLAHVKEHGIAELLLQRYIDLQVRGGILAAATRAFSGLRDRLLADPAFLFKVFTEIVIDSGCATFAEVRKRGDDFWKEFDLYMSDILVGFAVDAALVSMLAPMARFGSSAAASAARGRRPGLVPPGLAAALEALPSSMFEAALPGRRYSVAQRGATWLVKGAQYAVVGFSCGLIGQAMTTAIVLIKRNLRKPGEHEEEVKIPGMIPTALLWGGFMAVSSNTRYQIINGLERVVESSPLARSMPLGARVFTVLIRFSNNIFGSSQFVEVARWSGVQ